MKAVRRTAPMPKTPTQARKPARVAPRKSTPAPDVYRADCPTRDVLNHLTSRWSMLIVVLLLDGTHRFSELARRIGGVSEKMLAQSLQVLEADGFVVRTVHPTIPPKVEYSLSALGREVAPRVQALASWVEANVATVLRIRSERAAQAHTTAKR